MTPARTIQERSFDEAFGEFRLTYRERELLVWHLAEMRARNTVEALLPGKRDDELERLAKEASPGNLDSAQITEDGRVTCPCCEGDGVVDAETWINIDRLPLTIQICGIGDALTKYEAFFRAANPQAILALIAENRRLEGRAQTVAEMRERIGCALDEASNQARESSEQLSRGLNHVYEWARLKEKAEIYKQAARIARTLPLPEANESDGLPDKTNTRGEV